MASNVTIPMLQEMKREGKKIVAAAAWEHEIAAIADRAGVEIVVVGDSVGVNLWGQDIPSKRARRDAGLSPRRSAAGQAGAGLLRCSVRADPGTESARQGGDPNRQGDGRRSHQGRWRRRFSRNGARPGARRHSGHGPIRHHAADRAAIRHSLAAQSAAGAEVPPAMNAKLVEEAKRLRRGRRLPCSISPIRGRSRALPW